MAAPAIKTQLASIGYWCAEMIILYLWLVLIIGILAYEIKHHSIG